MSFSLLDPRARREMAPFCQAHGVHLLAYGTLAGGWLSERWLGRDGARLGTDRNVVADEVRALHPRDWGLGGAAAGAARGSDRWPRVTASRSPTLQAGTSLEQPGVAAVIIGARLGERDHIDDTRPPVHMALEPMPIGTSCRRQSTRSTRFPAIVETSTASRRSSRHLAISVIIWTRCPRRFAWSRAQGAEHCACAGTSWERLAGFARAVRQGRRISVSGTTATLGDRLIGGRDAAAQTHFAIDKIEGALQSLGATLAHVVRTRVYVKNIADWEAVARAHGDAFRRDAARQHTGRGDAGRRRVPGRDRSRRGARRCGRRSLAIITVSPEP